LMVKIGLIPARKLDGRLRLNETVLQKYSLLTTVRYARILRDE